MDVTTTIAQVEQEIAELDARRPRLVALLEALQAYGTPATAPTKTKAAKAGRQPRPSEPREELDAETTKLLKAMRALPEASPVSEIERHAKTGLSGPTLRRRLADLVTRKLVVVSGAGAGTRCRAVAA